MKLMPFKRPTDHYDEGIKEIDEKICKLINERKKLSNNNPGFPPLEYISAWADRYEICNNMLNVLFGALYNEKLFIPIIEPQGFRKNIPVLKLSEIDKHIYSVLFIRQYENCSIINICVDWDNYDELIDGQLRMHDYDLFIDEQYNCRLTSSGGREGHQNASFVVSPPLPDDISGINLVLKEQRKSLNNKFEMNDKTEEAEIVFHL